jgi:hemerythrin-like domain-containing protein
MLRDPALIPLSHQHQHALALCVITDRTLAADPDDADLEAQARAIVAQFDSEMRKHFELEERIFFPALISFPGVREVVSALLGEHRRITELVDSLRNAADRTLMSEFSALLRQHVRKEENVLFEEAQRLLSREQLDQMGGEFARGG